MGYFHNLEDIWCDYLTWLALAKERGNVTTSFEKKAIKFISKEKRRLLKKVKIFTPKEPDSLEEIKKLRPSGPRCLIEKIDKKRLSNQILGAWLGRAAGCILGIPCEGMSKDEIRFACFNHKLPYPLRSYWKMDPKNISPDNLHYQTTPRKHFLEPYLSYVGADDDLAYTILGLLLLEEKGIDFTTKDVASFWLKYLPFACTAEEIALGNLKKGVSPYLAGELNNPYMDWIGADIRSDPWAYGAPGWPEKAAEMAFRDAFLTHRGTGIHAAMFFSAAISAAFVCDHPMEAIRIGLTEIPKNCRLAVVIRQTIKWCEKDNDWNKTTDRILEFFKGMNVAHSLNNAALTIAGIFYGKGDFTKTISLTVMGGFDTDCTGATAGSLLGAIIGADNIPEYWKKPLGEKVETYLVGHRMFRLKNIAQRFTKLALDALRKSKHNTK
ncbi:MAG: ADP-ribosylglycohydrolase family protein [Candidatus Omnitrophica bacterium]|nr:ADP-ribosylglycohydrolase family protein [Candidatus Omnitrophota bacterium]